MHRVRPFKDTGEPRDMRRTTIAGQEETTKQTNQLYKLLKLSWDFRMNIAIKQLHRDFVGEVSGLDLSKPLSLGTVKQIEEGMDKFGVLIFHDQDMTDDQQIAYTKNFGDLELHIGSNVLKADNMISNDIISQDIRA